MSRTDAPHSPHGGEMLERFSRLAMREQPIAALLQQLVELTGRLMPLGTETSVALRVHGVLTFAATGALSRRLDEAQFADGRGPGIHAARTGVITEVGDTRTDPRWPDHGRRAAADGVLSSLSIPVSGDAETSGALTVYAPAADAFDDALRRVARRLAPSARAALAGVQDRDRARALADELDVELETRAIIGQARGILVQRYQVTPERAYELMARMSERSRRGLREVAVGVVRMDGDRPS
jgi:GAF domain-containing protein